PGASRFPPPADRGPHRQGHEGRPRALSRCRRVRLPRQAGEHRTASLGLAAVVAQVNAEGGGMHVADRVNILLVDDQPAKLLTYEAMLDQLGANLIKASSGREALEQLLKQEITLVLMDVSMPDLDGFELAEIIR